METTFSRSVVIADDDDCLPELVGLVDYDNYFEYEGYNWHIMVRPGGSVCLYGTQPGVAVHAVVYDTLDRKPPNELARELIVRLSEMAEGISALLAGVGSGDG